MVLRRRWIGRRAGDAELRVEFRMAGEEDADEWSRGKRRADGLHFGEFGALAEHVEKRRALPGDRFERPGFLQHDRP